VSSIAIAGVVFVCIFGGALLGMSLHAALPEHHLSADTKDVVKVAIALVATMGALVLSLLISSAKVLTTPAATNWCRCPPISSCSTAP
jgi:hypothetical protein